jgi:DNA polymerase
MTQSKQLLLDQIMADILEQDICPDLAKQATNLVFGDGNPDADIVIIGEAPGKREDEQGLPFVGASGKFLAEMLASINMRREQIYITNIVKYRPPNNRDPLPAEKAAFLPFLERQLDVIQPLLVLTLGRHSMNCFLPGLQISEVHGEPKRKDNRVYLPLYHPAAALYNGGLRQTLIEDFQNIPQILQLIRKEK